MSLAKKRTTISPVTLNLSGLSYCFPPIKSILSHSSNQNHPITFHPSEQIYQIPPPRSPISPTTPRTFTILTLVQTASSDTQYNAAVFLDVIPFICHPCISSLNECVQFYKLCKIRDCFVRSYPVTETKYSSLDVLEVESHYVVHAELGSMMILPPKLIDL